MADAVFYFVVLVIIYVVVRILHTNSYAEAPRLYHRNSKFIREIIKMCPTLTEVYLPTLSWGKSGHLQTFIYGKMGRFNCPVPKGVRRSVMMNDGATCTFDVFEPTEKHTIEGDYTICIAPGIANSSESKYIRTFVNHARSHGYRVAVLNHLGALKSVPLTSPRIFTYGCTDEYAAMVQYIEDKHIGTFLIAVGFSMGANVVLKYLGEDIERQDKFICGLSLCQGYDCYLAKEFLHNWEKLRRIYNFAMTENQKLVLKRNKDMLFGAGAKSYYLREGKKQPEYDLDKIFEATSLMHIDESFTWKMAGFDNLDSFLNDGSSSGFIPSIHIPLMVLNAEDDPIVPPTTFHYPKTHAERVNNSMFVLTKHGGHLGFFEGGILQPNTVTWLDRMIVEYVDALVEITQRCEELSD